MIQHVLLLEHLAYLIRKKCLEATTAAGSGHPTSCLSAVELCVALFFEHLKKGDRFILSKGHAAPLLYALYEQLGLISYEQLLTLRQFDSPLEGHPTPRFEYVSVATGSLGQGLSIGLGISLGFQLKKQKNKIYVLLGDSELTEGSNWEAAALADHYHTDNLIALVDMNHLGQSNVIIEDQHPQKIALKFAAFGWHTIIIDGHSFSEISDALQRAHSQNKPTVIVAQTHKGKGLEHYEDKNGFHGKAFNKDQLPELLNELKKTYQQAADYELTLPDQDYIKKRAEIVSNRQHHKAAVACNLSYSGESISTRKAYGQALELAGKDSQIIALDAEVKNSTYAELFEKSYPERFIECFIAEQNMIGMAVGLTTLGFVPCSSTFAAFLTRAHDQLRMAAIGQAPLRVVGSHAGVSIGQDGPSQMGLEDIALMAGLPESVILYPCDGVSTYKLLECMLAYTNGISYLRITRSDTPIVYSNTNTFHIGGSKVLHASDADVVCVITAGITVFEALHAYEKLKKEDVTICVIDAYSVKPLDTTTIFAKIKASKGRYITVEDHYRQGGLGSLVAQACMQEEFTGISLAVDYMPRSGKPEELRAFEKINAAAIVDAVYQLINR